MLNKSNLLSIKWEVGSRVKTQDTFSMAPSDRAILLPFKSCHGYAPWLLQCHQCWKLSSRYSRCSCGIGFWLLTKLFGFLVAARDKSLSISWTFFGFLKYLLNFRLKLSFRENHKMKRQNVIFDPLPQLLVPGDLVLLVPEKSSIWFLVLWDVTNSAVAIAIARNRWICHKWFFHRFWITRIRRLRGDFNAFQNNKKSLEHHFTGLKIFPPLLREKVS